MTRLDHDVNVSPKLAAVRNLSATISYFKSKVDVVAKMTKSEVGLVIQYNFLE